MNKIILMFLSAISFSVCASGEGLVAEVKHYRNGEVAATAAIPLTDTAGGKGKFEVSGEITYPSMVKKNEVKVSSVKTGMTLMLDKVVLSDDTVTFNYSFASSDVVHWEEFKAKGLSLQLPEVRSYLSSKEKVNAPVAVELPLDSYKVGENGCMMTVRFVRK